MRLPGPLASLRGPVKEPSPPRLYYRLPLLYVLWLLAFLALAVAAALYDRFPGDLAVTLRVQSLGNGTLTSVMRGISLLGTDPFGIGSVLLLSGALWLWGRKRASSLVLLTLIADAASFVIKEIVDRPRPPAELVLVSGSTSPGFPSGHAVHFVVFFGLLAFLAPRILPGRMLPLAVRVVAAILIALVGFSRIYLGVHWASDVLGGYLLGMLVLWPLAALYGRKNRPEVSPAADESRIAGKAKL